MIEYLELLARGVLVFGASILLTACVLLAMWGIPVVLWEVLSSPDDDADTRN